MTAVADSVVDGLTIDAVRTPGLGDTTYVVAYDGIGLLIDPQRDIERFLNRFSDLGVLPRWVLETHLHNDYVSGGSLAATATGAELILPAGAAPAYPHTPAFHGEEFGYGDIAVRPIHTPGHTPEHVSYLLLVSGAEVAVFSGGSLLVGAAGRPDLLGMHRADSLARLQYRSVNRLSRLPDHVGLYPTHGAGSFCAASGAGDTTSTIGSEKDTNPVLAYPDEDSFVSGQLINLQPYPAYYAHMGEANLMGGTAISPSGPPTIGAQELADLLGTVTVIDVRSRMDFAHGHIPGAIGVELRDDFGTWTGWIVDIDEPIVLVGNAENDLDEAVLQLARIGYDKVTGVMLGMDQWNRQGFPVQKHSTATAAEVVKASGRGESILDVRSPGEFAEHCIPGSIHIYVPDLTQESLEVFQHGQDIWVVCGSGYRASIAAGVLEEYGCSPTVLTDAGVGDILRMQSTDGTQTSGVPRNRDA